MYYCNFTREQIWVDRAREASGKAVALRWDLPEVHVSQAWVLYAAGLHDEAVRMAKKAIERKRDCEGSYYLLCRSLFAAGRRSRNCGGLRISHRIERRGLQRLCAHHQFARRNWAMKRPEANGARRIGRPRKPPQASSRGRAGAYPSCQTTPIWPREEDAMRELNLALTLRANEASILYNAACVYCTLNKKPEALDALSKAWTAGSKDAVWARRDPDLMILHGDPEFERLYPEQPAG